ncbi:MAG: undecaprenyl-phosphate glucose phosphotransferase, partial [Pseudomonas sp.]
MVFEPRSSRSLLQRRSGVSNAIQAGLDGIAVTGIAWYLIVDQFGYITSDYVIMLLLLIGALAVIYDHYGIYRSNVGLSIKAFRLFKAWSATFCFLMVMAFLTKQSETYSRLLVGKLFVSGYFLQLFLHYTVREVQKRFMANALRTDNALIIGTGDLANFLYLKIS